VIPVADAGYVVALVNRADPDHARVAEVARSLRVAPWLPTPTVTEICYVLGREMGAGSVATFLRYLAEPSAGLSLLEPTPDDLRRAAEVLERYGATGLDFGDALLVAVAERLEATTLLTLDRRHLAAVRPRHRAHFDLLPA
jgi:predicted nucleic acid-binding protein